MPTRVRRPRRPLVAAVTLAALVAAVSAVVGLLARPPSPPPTPSAPPLPPSPTARDGGAMAYDPATHSVVLYGGLVFSSTGQTALGDTWSWDGSGWTRLDPKVSPPPLTAALMAYDPAQKVIVLTGGETSHPGTEVSPSDATWTWDGVDWTPQPGGTTPASAGRAALATDTATGRAVLVTTAADCRGTATWLWDSGRWQQVHPAISPAGGHIDGLTLDEATGQVLLLVDSASCPSAATAPTAWVWDGSTWQAAPTAAPPTSGILVTSFTTPLLVGPRRTYAWAGGGSGPEDSGWTLIGTSPGVVDAAAAYDGATEEVVLFSGVCAYCAGNDLSDDTWTYPSQPGFPGTDVWSLLAGPSPPPPPAQTSARASLS
jgi:hypothetical protein